MAMCRPSWGRQIKQFLPLFSRTFDKKLRKKSAKSIPGDRASLGGRDFRRADAGEKPV
jgi:hypothetical protein